MSYGPKLSLASTSRPNWARALCLVLISVTSVATAAAAGPAACYLTCTEDKPCELLNTHDNSPHRLAPVDNKRIDSCHAMKVTAGAVMMRYRHKGQWFSPPDSLGKDTLLAGMFAKYPPDACAVPTPKCLQGREAAKSTSRAGHGADSLESAPAGTGEPCSQGLPCGQVLPPAAEWSFKLEDGAVQGQWIVKLHRGAPPAGVPREFTLPVAAGMVKAEGRQFSTGATYSYRLIDASGKALASGEFEVTGASRLAALKKLAAERAARDGLSPEAGWIDAMAAFGFDWDAYQSTLTR